MSLVEERNIASIASVAIFSSSTVFLIKVFYLGSCSIGQLIPDNHVNIDRLVKLQLICNKTSNELATDHYFLPQS